MMKKKVAVLGAGPMGLGVAYQLIKDGYEPIVFEADDRVGGMTASFDFSGTEIERYYHFHCISDKDFLNVLDELGLSNKMNWVVTKMGYYFNNKVHPWGNPMALLKFPGVSLVSKIRYGLHAFLSTKRSNWKPLDGQSATVWIRKWIGKDAYSVLWKTLFDYKFYDYTENLSAAWIWSRIKRIGCSRYDMFREKLGYLEGGSQTLMRALQHYINENGGEVRLQQPVTEVKIEKGKVQGVCVGDKLERFDHVISTVPTPYISRLMPGLPQETKDKFNSLDNIAVVCVIAKLKTPVTDNFWLNINDPDMDIPGLVEYTNLRPMKEHIVYVPFYMPGEHPKFQEDNQVFLDKVKRYIQKINPSIKEGDFIDIRASRYRFAQPICPPNFLEKLPPMNLPIEGLLAADTSYYYPEDRGISESLGYGRMMAKQVCNA